MDFSTYTMPDINVKKASVNGKVYDVLEYDEYVRNFELNKDRTDIAVKTEYNGETLILPYNGRYKGDPITPGIYNAGIMDYYKMPDESNMQKYIPERIISMSNKDDIADIINSGELYKKLDEPFITSPDNITYIAVRESDHPEMKCLKMALNAKKIDLDKYAGRFGENFPNDKRQLKGNTATLNIIKRYCRNCDMEATLTLKDKNPDVPNPMGKEISISLTDSYIEDGE